MAVATANNDLNWSPHHWHLDPEELLQFSDAPCPADSPLAHWGNFVQNFHTQRGAYSAACSDGDRRAFVALVQAVHRTAAQPDEQRQAVQAFLQAHIFVPEGSEAQFVDLLLLLCTKYILGGVTVHLSNNNMLRIKYSLLESLRTLNMYRDIVFYATVHAVLLPLLSSAQIRELHHQFQGYLIPMSSLLTGIPVHMVRNMGIRQQRARDFLMPFLAPLFEAARQHDTLRQSRVFMHAEQGTLVVVPPPAARSLPALPADLAQYTASFLTGHQMTRDLRQTTATEIGVRARIEERRSLQAQEDEKREAKKSKKEPGE